MRQFNATFALCAALLLLITQGGADCISDLPTGDDSSTPQQTLEQAKVPKTAEKITEAAGEITWTADGAGTLYLWDTSDEVVAVVTDIRKGQVLKVNPSADRVWVDSETRSRSRLDGGHVYRVYLDRAGTQQDASKPIVVPKTASIVRQGMNTDLSYKAEVDGVIYLYDANARKVIGAFDLRAGQRFTVSPSQDLASIDGKRKFQQTLSTRVTYRIYFDVNQAN